MRNTQRPRNNRPSPRTTPRPRQNIVFTTPINIVRHNQKIPRESHIDNNAQFIFCLLVIWLGVSNPLFAHARRQSRHSVFTQHLAFGFQVITKTWQQWSFMNIYHKTTPACDFNRILARFGQIREQIPHFFGRFEILFRRFARTIGVNNLGLTQNTGQGIFGLVIRRSGTHDVICCDNRNV